MMCISLQANAQSFERCDPLKEPGAAICAKENAVLDHWEPLYTELYKAQTQMQTEMDSRDWKSLSATFKSCVAIFNQFLDAAKSQAAGPGTNGFSGNILELKESYRYIFQNAGLKPPPSFEDALAYLKTAIENRHDKQAATVAIFLTQQFYERGHDFIKSLSEAAGDQERQALTKTSEKLAAERTARIEPKTMKQYTSGFWDRVKLFKAGLEWVVIALILGMFFGYKKNRPKVVVKAPVIAFGAFLPVWGLQVVLPVLPGWGIALLMIAIFVALWSWSESHGWNTGLAQQTTHGSARWGDRGEMVAGGHICEQGRPPQELGFALGRANTQRSHDPRFRHMGHILTCAPTGAGKGIGAVMPNLLEYPGSALVLDIKGENYAVTARARRDMGQEVYVLDPFGIAAQKSHKFNWLDALNLENPDVVAESAGLSEMLVIPDNTEKEGGHWNETAKDLLRGLIMYVCSLPADRRHMPEVRRLITSGKDLLDETLADMAVFDGGFGVVARAANSFLAKGIKEQDGVLSTAIRHTAFLDDPRIATVLQESDFCFADIKQRPMTVYVVLPPAKLAANARLMRGCIGLALAAITGNSEQPRQKIAFFLDEFAQLGRMSAIEDSISLVRGYGAAFWIFVQDLSQLKGVYPKWQTFLANSAKQFFGTADFDTAKYISDSLGQATVNFETSGRSRPDAKVLGSTSESGHLHGRPLLTPDEVMRLGPDRPLIFVNGESPYLLQRLNYLVDPEYQGLADLNPYHT